MGPKIENTMKPYKGRLERFVVHEYEANVMYTTYVCSVDQDFPSLKLNDYVINLRSSI